MPRAAHLVLLAAALVVSGCLTPTTSPTGGPKAASTPTASAPHTSTPPSTSTSATPTGSPPGSGGTTAPQTNTSTQPRQDGGRGAPLPSPHCTGTGPVRFNTSPMRPEDFSALEPYGLVVGGHVTPIDHMYFDPANRSLGRDAYEVRAIADAIIVDIETRPSGPNGTLLEYRIWFDHTCTFHSYVDLVTSLSPRLAAFYANFSERATRSVAETLAVHAGDLLGRIGGQTLDFGVYDDEVNLTGFVDWRDYTGESWKIHTVDPFPYFDEPVRSMLLAKDVRVAEPRAGKIDQDIDGRLSGNWFLDGSGGYAGPGHGVYGYWSGHLSFLRDAYVPDHLLLSIGNYSGNATQFAIRGNGPAYENVSVASGLVKYELVDWNYFDGDDPNAGTFHSFPHPFAHPAWTNTDTIHGVVLVQLTSARVLKMETFPGKTAADVTGFDDAVRTYVR
ncbi:MAG: hypothetical protein ACYDCK_12045 [Thermoplasmatota archaeon]